MELLVALTYCPNSRIGYSGDIHTLCLSRFSTLPILGRVVLIDELTYHKRSNAESMSLGSRRRYGDLLWSRAECGGLAIKSAIRNVGHVIEWLPR